LSIHAAGFVGAAAVVANAAGNLFAGILVRRGVPFWLVAAGAITFVTIATAGMFMDGAPVLLVATLAAASLGVSGLIPASIFSVTPRFAPSPALMAMALGLLIQTSNIGNLTGAAALAAFVEQFGWSKAPLVFLAVTVAGIAIAMGVKALGKKNA
jgi:predicted MFS family arabinose efflux permease